MTKFAGAGKAPASRNGPTNEFQVFKIEAHCGRFRMRIIRV